VFEIWRSSIGTIAGADGWGVKGKPMIIGPFHVAAIMLSTIPRHGRDEVGRIGTRIVA
jgi:hypothetical protein